MRFLKKLLSIFTVISMTLCLLVMPMSVQTEASNVQDPKVYTSGTHVLDLKGEFVAYGSDGAILVKDGAQLTINGTDETEVHGTLGYDNYSMAVWAQGDRSKVVINGGYYTNETDGTERGTDLIYASGGATIEILGGKFKAAKTEWTLNCKDNSTSTITVKGGSFYKFDPSKNNVSPTGRTEIIVPDGYKVVQSGDWYHVVRKEKVYTSGTHVLDLKGEFVAYGSDGAILVKDGAQLTINGTDETEVHGTLGYDNYSMAVWAKGDGSKVVINGGYYTNETDGTERGTDLIYASGGATIEIFGGKFKAAKTEWTLNCKDDSTSTITVKGGSFYKFDPSKNNVSPTGRTEIIVPDGYKVVKDGDWYTVVGKGKVVSNGKEYPSLKTAIDANKDNETAVLELYDTVTWYTGPNHGSTPLIEKDSKLTQLVIDGKNSATLEAIGQGVGSLTAANGGEIVFKNLTIKDSSESYAEGSWEFGYLEFGGKLVFENCHFVNAVIFTSDNGNYDNTQMSFKDCIFNSNDANQYDVWVAEGIATFEDCIFEGYRGLKLHEAYGSKIKSVTVDDCDFNKLAKKPGVAIGNLDGSEVTIVNCFFVECKPGDAKDDPTHGVPYIFETDTLVEKFKLTLRDNFVCTGHNGELSTKRYIEEIRPTYEKEGNIEFWICCCGKIFADNKETKELENIKSTILPKLESKVEVNLPQVDTSKPVEEVKPIVKEEVANTVLNESKDIVKDILENKENSQISNETKENIKDALDAGKNIDTEIIIETVKEEEVKVDANKVVYALVSEDVKKEYGDVKVAQYLNIEIVLKAGNDILGNVNEVKEELSFTVAIPEELKEKDRTFYVVRVHDGVTEILPTTLNSDGTLTFKTDKFSTYALAYVDKVENTKPTTPPITDNQGSDKIETNKPNNTTKPSTDNSTIKPSENKPVNTGDETNIALYVAICGLALLGAAYIALTNKREEV